MICSLRVGLPELTIAIAITLRDLPEWPYTEVHWSLEVLLIANLSIVIFCRFPRREVRIPCDASSDSTRGALQDLRKLSRRFKSKQIT